MTTKENRLAGNEPASTNTKSLTAEFSNSSQSVSFWSVHEFVAAVLDQANGWPMLGTPAWCSLAADDPRKWAAVLDGGQHHALRIETAQQARADASKAISGAADWPAVSREIRQLNDFRSSRPWAKRVVA